MSAMMEGFVQTGASHAKIETFLDADPFGRGSVRDQIAADMTNDVMEALGRRQRQSVDDIKRIRARGNWIGLDQRPRE